MFIHLVPRFTTEHLYHDTDNRSHTDSERCAKLFASETAKKPYACTERDRQLLQYEKPASFLAGPKASQEGFSVGGRRGAELIRKGVAAVAVCRDDIRGAAESMIR